MNIDQMAHNQVATVLARHFGSDFEHREKLIEKLKEESLANKRARSGPTVACGMAVFDPDSDREFSNVFERADNLMYENKKELKRQYTVETFKEMDRIDEPISDERKRVLDGMFGALLTRKICPPYNQRVCIKRQRRQSGIFRRYYNPTMKDCGNIYNRFRYIKGQVI